MVGRELARHLVREPARWAPVVVLVAVAVAVYGGTRAGIDQIAQTTDILYEELGLLDLEIETAPVISRPSETQLLASVPDLEAATWRTKTQGTVFLPDGTASAARLLSLDPRRRPAVSDVRLIEGRWLEVGEPQGAVLDSTFARDHGLTVGTSLEIHTLLGARSMTVVGIGVFPEYLLTSVDENFTIPVRGSVAILAVSDELARRSLRFWSFANNLAVRFRPGADPITARTALEAALAPRVDVRRVTPRSGLYSVTSHGNRLRTFRDFLPTVVGVFDALAGLVLVFGVHGMARGWRAQAGTLLAFGVPLRSLVAGWTLAITGLVLVGIALGALGAVSLARLVSSAYLDATGFPLLLGHPSPRAILQAAALALALVPVALLPVVSLFRRRPVELLREVPPAASSGLLHLGWRLPTSVRLGVRSVVRRPVGSLVSSLAMAGTLVMAGSFSVFADAQEANVERFLSSRQWAAMVKFQDPLDTEDLHTLLSAAGSGTIEPIREVPVSVRNGERTIEPDLVSLRWPSVLQRESWLLDGRSATGADEVALGFRSARDLGVWVGDSVVIVGGGHERSAQVVGVINGYIFDRIYAAPTLADALVGPGNPTSALVSPSPAPTLANDPRVAAILPGDQMARVTERTNRSFVVIVRAYGQLGTLAAALVVGGTLLARVRERATEFAVLRSFGIRRGFVARVVLVETFVLTAIALAVALPAVFVVTRVFQARIATVGLFVPLPDWTAPLQAMGWPVVGCLVAGLIAGWRAGHRPMAPDLAARATNP